MRAEVIGASNGPPVGLDAASLTSCFGNLISLLALPSVCEGRALGDILGITLDSLSVLLQFDLGYMRLSGAEGVEAFHPSRRADADEIRGFARPLLSLPVPVPGTVVAGPAGLGDLHALVVPVGFYADTGMLLLASRRPDFPDASELILVRAAASLVASAIENARTRESLEKARRELELANRAKDEFLAMLGHELRNPLAPIVTALALMNLREGETASRERTIIARQVERLRLLVDDLLDVSRITRGMIEIKPTRIELARLIVDAVEVASPLLEQRRHHLSVSCPQQGILVEVDPIRCAQAISNVLVNAAKYTEPQGRISIAGSKDGQWATIRIVDNGIGISQEMLPRLFELFSQERRALDRSEGGLGLGLAIAKSLLTLHGGTIEAQSAGQGRGSEFTIRLPLQAEDMPDPEPERARQSRSTAAAPSSRTHRVLVVDDNADAADLLADLIASWAMEVRVARDGAEALRVAAQFNPDAILLDLGLPVLDGYQVARRLRALPATREVRLIAISGYGQESDRRLTREGGFDEHLVKPVDFDQLRLVLESFLGLR